MPDVRGRHRDVFGEASVAIDANDSCVRADVCVACPAEETTTVDNVPFGGNTITALHSGDQPPDFGNVSRELVTDDERWLAAVTRPRVPVVDVDIGSTHSRAAHADEHFVVANARLDYVSKHKAGTGGFLYDRLQLLSES